MNASGKTLADLIESRFGLPTDAGRAIVPTDWIEPDDAAQFPTGEYVLKPSVGAGSRGAGRFDSRIGDSATAAADHLRDLQRQLET